MSGLPSRWVRRPLSLLVVTGLVVAASALPLLLILATVASVFVPGRWRPLRLLAFALTYLALEVVGLAVGFVLWVASGFGWAMQRPALQRAHYSVLRALLATVDAVARRVFRVRIETDGTGWSPLDDGVPGSTNAMIVLSRHAGPGDSFLLVRRLLDRDHLRRPRIVLRSALQLDPLLDVYLNRLPSAWIPSRPGSSAEVIGSISRLASGMGDQDAILIFPEGGNFTPARRTRAIAKLRTEGRDVAAARADAMPNVLPPRPGGVQAALSAAPGADVLFVAHTGLESFSTLREVWTGLPMDTTLHLRWDFVPAAQVPRDPDEQVDWLYARWADLDAWITAQPR